MSIRKAATAALVAASMVTVPAVAQVAPASKAVSAPARQGATVAKKEELRGGSVIIALLAAAAIIGAIVIAADGSNKPASP